MSGETIGGAYYYNLLDEHRAIQACIPAGPSRWTLPPSGDHAMSPFTDTQIPIAVDAIAPYAFDLWKHKPLTDLQDAKNRVSEAIGIFQRGTNTRPTANDVTDILETTIGPRLPSARPDISLIDAAFATYKL